MTSFCNQQPNPILPNMKKVLAVCVFVFCIFSLSTFSQTKTNKQTSKTPSIRAEVTIKGNIPPEMPKPVEEDAKIWNEFASAKHGFWITFPAPEENVHNDDIDEFASFATSTKKAHYSLAVKNLLVSLNNSQLNDLFDTIVAQTEDDKTRLIGKKDVYLNGTLGKELVYEENRNIVYGRFYIVESKLFMLSVSVPKKDYNKSFDRWAQKFFDSFGVKVNSRMDA
jgi:hypothetical protein